MEKLWQILLFCLLFAAGLRARPQTKQKTFTVTQGQKVANPSLGTITSVNLGLCKGIGNVREAWVETLETKEYSRTGELVPLHPSIWSVQPRIDCIHENIEWQKMYQKVSYRHVKTKHEMPGGKGTRPWPQKGTGRARHRTIRSPIWINGGKPHGAKNPHTYFYMLNRSKRLKGLIHTLAIKFAQDDVHIVRDLDIPTSDPQFIDDVIDERGWGLTTLMVDANDIMPEKITEATDQIPHVNLMPAYGLNCYSMLKHKTLVLTVDALNHIEDKLLFAMHRIDQTQMVGKNSRMSRSQLPDL